jgi:hypothetical protein
MQYPTLQKLEFIQLFFNEEGLTARDYTKYLEKIHWDEYFDLDEPRFQLKWMDKRCGAPARLRVLKFKTELKARSTEHLESLLRSLVFFRNKTNRDRRLGKVGY